MIEARNIIHMNNKPLTRSFPIHNESSILVKKADLNYLSVGILSLRTLDEWNLNIAIEAQDEHDSTNNTVIDPELIRCIIDETLCLRGEGGVATYQSYLEDQLQLHR